MKKQLPEISKLMTIKTLEKLFRTDFDKKDTLLLKTTKTTKTLRKLLGTKVNAFLTRDGRFDVVTLNLYFQLKWTAPTDSTRAITLFYYKSKKQ